MGFPRVGGGDWEPLLLAIEPRKCRVCSQGLYRDQTLFRGGWSRCTICDEFVHYSCLASGRVSFLKRRPRVCKTCLEGTPTANGQASAPIPPVPTVPDTPVAAAESKAESTTSPDHQAA
ncbi:MAG: hypothetical protein U0172_08385 [Nitrospiraceae bacterium]